MAKLLTSPKPKLSSKLLVQLPAKSGAKSAKTPAKAPAKTPAKALMKTPSKVSPKVSPKVAPTATAKKAVKAVVATPAKALPKKPAAPVPKSAKTVAPKPALQVASPLSKQKKEPKAARVVHAPAVTAAAPSAPTEPTTPLKHTMSHAQETPVEKLGEDHDFNPLDADIAEAMATDSNTTEKKSDEHQDLHHSDSDFDLDDSDFSLEDDFDFGDLQAPGPDTCQFTEHDFALALRDFQVDMQGASGVVEKLDNTKKVHLPGLKGASGKRKKPVEHVTPSITADDFEEGHQRDAFVIIQEFYRVLLNSDSKMHSRLKAIEFFFCPATQQRINFDEAAVAIDPNIRPDVFRLRLMFEFWNRWTVFGQELPEDALPPPDRVMSMANYYGPAAVALVTECWFYPGIEEPELFERAENYLDQNELSYNKIHLQREFKNLVSNYILSMKTNSVYCTGKNPVMEVNDHLRQSGKLSGARASQVSWAKLF